MSKLSIMYSVRIKADNNTFSFNERYHQIFNNLFYFFADAEIIPNSIKRYENETYFELEEQTRDVTFHNFTKDKIIRCLENIKERYNLNFDFSVEEIENPPIKGPQNSSGKTRGGKKSRRKAKRSRRSRRSRNSKTKQRRN
jgi:hypothetical protein